jgi:hypothetical protein
LGTRIFGIFDAVRFDFIILVILTRIYQTSRLFKPATVR